MNNVKKVRKISEVDIKNIIYHEPRESEDKNRIVSKIWYRDDNLIHTLLIQTSYMEIFQFTREDNYIFLYPERQFELLMKNIDELTLEFMTQTNLSGKFNLIGFSYKTLINEMNISCVESSSKNTQNNEILIYRIKVLTQSNTKNPTKFFVNKENVPLSV